MRLLLAEDERSLSRALTAILEGNRYSVDAVFDGAEALAYLETGHYDAAILDIMMPKLDGLTVLRRLRAAGSRVPVLLLTAKGEVEDKVLGLDSGANDYLAKPFSTPELLARIRAMTRNLEVQQGVLLRMGNTVLDCAAFQLSAPNGSIMLPNKEFQMMELLLRCAPGLIPAERFLETVWGLDSETESNVVSVHISRLRKKLAELGADVEIAAARNAGYYLRRTE